MSIIDYWINPCIQNKQITDALLTFFPYLRNTDNPNPSTTLYISSQSDVENNYQTNKNFISPHCLEELSTNNIIKNFFTTNFKNYQQQFPFGQPIQYFSFCLLGKNVSLPYLFYENNDCNSFLPKYEKMLHLCGATITTNIEDTNVLIEISACSPIAYRAAKLHIPIVTIKWIEDVYDSGCDPGFDSYKLPYFNFCTFTSTDIPQKENKELSKIVMKGCGNWSNSFEPNTSFLVSYSLTQSQKTYAALTIGRFIVKPEWIYETQFSSDIIPPYDYILNWWDIDSNQKSYFSHYSFYISDKIKCSDKMANAIKIAGGIVIDNPKIANYVIIEDSVSKSDFYNSLSNIPNIKIVSGAYIWKCLEKKRLNPIDNYIDSAFLFTIPDVEKQYVTILNIKNEQQNELLSILRRLNINVGLAPSSKTTIIVVPSDYNYSSIPSLFSNDNLTKCPEAFTVVPNWVKDLAKEKKWLDPRQYSPSQEKYVQSNYQKDSLKTFLKLTDILNRSTPSQTDDEESQQLYEITYQYENDDPINSAGNSFII